MSNKGDRKNPHPDKFFQASKIYKNQSKNKKCCPNWRICWTNYECILIQITWNPVRVKLHQKDPSAGQLVTLDCYFVPPNILEIGLIVKINKEFIYIYFISGNLLIREIKDIFIFPESHLLYRFEEDINKSYRESDWIICLNKTDVKRPK